MLVVSALGLNDNCGNLSSVRMNDGAMRQTDVNVDGSILVCSAKVENGSAIFHVLLDCHATAQTWRLLPVVNVNFAPRVHCACLRPNEKEIRHGRMLWQTDWAYFEMGPLSRVCFVLRWLAS
jgi:hypothetical protein